MNPGRSHADVVCLLKKARAGDTGARGQLLDRYRNDLYMLARVMLGTVRRPDLEASDLVQQTLLEAHRDLAHFRGSSGPEITAWLRQIFIHNLKQQARDAGREKRGGKAKHRLSLDELLERSSLWANLIRNRSMLSPIDHASRREQGALLADALARLPEDHAQRSSYTTCASSPYPQSPTRWARLPRQ